MRTNLADNPIATWDDLRIGLGYRLPYGVINKYTEEERTSWLKKGVTLHDLTYCPNGYLPEYYSDFSALTDSQKRLYITNNTILSLPTPLHTITVNPMYDIQVLADNSTSVTLRSENGSSFYSSAELLWYKFTATESMQDCTITYENLRLYVTATGTVNASLHGSILIRQVGTQNVIAQGMITSVNLADAENLKVEITMPSSFNIQKGRQYEIVLSIYAVQSIAPGDSGISGGNTGGNVVVNPNIPGLALKILTLTFTTASATLKFESTNKCVPYKRILNNHDVTVPVYVYIKNNLVVVTYATSVNFYYRYSLRSSPSVYNTIWIGGGELCNSLGRKDSVSKVYNITLNPQVDGEVENDQLYITFGDTNTTKLLGLQYVENGVTYSWGSKSATKLHAYYPNKDFSGKWFHSTMRQLTEIHASISGD